MTFQSYMKYFEAYYKYLYKFTSHILNFKTIKIYVYATLNYKIINFEHRTRTLNKTMKKNCEKSDFCSAISRRLL